MSIFLCDFLDLSVPDIQVMYIGDSDQPQDFSRPKMMASLGARIKLLADIDSTHSGTIVNGRCYPGHEFRASMDTWTQPYAKAFLDRHPASGLLASPEEPKVLGRVLGGRFVSLVDDLDADWVNPPKRSKGSGYVLNSVMVSDPDAVEKVMDQRILTVSVGMKADVIQCSVCMTDWAPSMIKNGEPPDECEHRPGNAYKVDAKHFKGELPFYFVSRKMTFDHIASTFKPAQPYSCVHGFRIVDSALQDTFIGETLTGNVLSLSLCDEDGRVVRLSGPRSGTIAAPPPISDSDAVILALMEAHQSLDFGSGHADGYDAVDLRAAIDRVASAGKFAAWRKQTAGLPRAGFFPFDAEAARAGIRFLNRYVGPDKDSLGLGLLAAMGDTKRVEQTSIGGRGMDWAQIVSLSEAILDKIKDLPEDAACDETVLRERLDAELFAKVSFESLTEDRKREISREDLEAEIDNAANGLLDKVLTTAERKRLPDSAFCGPDRSFPAHDKAHIRNAMSRLQQAKMSGEMKSRVRACLMRKAKKAGVEVSKDSQDKERVKELERRLGDAEGRANLLSAELKDSHATRDKLLAEVQSMLAARLLDLRAKLGKPDVVQLADAEKRTEYLAKISARSRESLEDAIADLEKETPFQASSDSAAVDPAMQVADPLVQVAAAQTKVPKPQGNRARFRARINTAGDAGK